MLKAVATGDRTHELGEKISAPLVFDIRAPGAETRAQSGKDCLVHSRLSHGYRATYRYMWLSLLDDGYRIGVPLI